MASGSEILKLGERGGVMSKESCPRGPSFDLAAKRHKKHKTKILWHVISMPYNE
jgi:hypothetical protein